MPTAEQGNPPLEARGKVTYAASFIDFSAAAAQRIDGRIIHSPAETKKIFVTKEP